MLKSHLIDNDLQSIFNSFCIFLGSDITSVLEIK